VIRIDDTILVEHEQILHRSKAVFVVLIIIFNDFLQLRDNFLAFFMYFFNQGIGNAGHHRAGIHVGSVPFFLPRYWARRSCIP
jgi:hypothetical protein